MSSFIENSTTLESMLNVEIPKVKLIFLGDAGVGKSSIINRFIHNIFDDKIDSTLGAQFSSKVIEYPNYKIALQFDIWDTAGQEKYKSVNKFFYRDAQIVVLVYDITRENTFDEIKNFWLNQIKCFGEKNAIICLCGAKNDLIAKECIKEEDARNYAKENQIYFRLTSSLNNEGIDSLFEFLGKIYLKKNNLVKSKNSFSLSSKEKKIIKKKKCC